MSFLLSIVNPVAIAGYDHEVNQEYNVIEALKLLHR
jgi:hypothetical protein